MLRIFGHLKLFKVHIAMILILTIGQAMTEVMLPKLMSDMVNSGILQENTGYISKIAIAMLLVALINLGVVVLISYIGAKISEGFSRSLRSKIFSKVVSFSLQDLEHFGTASLITRTTNDITQFQQIFSAFLRMIMVPMILIGCIIMAVLMNPKLSLILLILMPLLVVCVLTVGKKTMSLFKVLQSKMDRFNLVSREYLTGVKVIRAFNRTEEEHNRFNQVNKQYSDISVKANLIIGVVMPLMMFIMNIATLAVFGFGSILVNDGSMQIGNLMAYIQYMMQIVICVVFVSMMLTAIPRAQASAVRINEVLQTCTSRPDKEQEIVQEKLQGVIEFNNVTFSYSGAEQPALSRISFCAQPGQVTGIIGGTGSGKSTLINLIPRLYDVQTGIITIDGIDIRELPQQYVRAQIGLVPQKSVLFHRNTIENIRYGNEKASLEDIVHAAEVAQCTEFIKVKEDQHDTKLSPKGRNLSGGEKQRLSIARALVRRPSIYLFDDCFSALDAKTDAKLRSSLENETSKATVIMVSQRVNTIMNADQILVLNNGEIVGRGTHDSLMQTCPTYQEIVASQFTEEVMA